MQTELCIQLFIYLPDSPCLLLDVDSDSDGDQLITILFLNRRFVWKHKQKMTEHEYLILFCSLILIVFDRSLE